MSIRITIIESSPEIRAWVRDAIRPEMEIVAEFAQAPGAPELRAVRADVICFGEQAARRAARTGNRLALDGMKLICLVSTATTHAVDFALTAGAFGCVLNASIPLEIAPAIETVAAGRYFASPSITSLVATRYRDHLLHRPASGNPKTSRT